MNLGGENMRRSIWDEFKRMQMEFDKLFSSMLDYEDFEEPYLPYSNRMLAKRSPGDYYKPMIDYYEDDKEFIATIELPGVNREDIEVSIGDDNQLEIKVEKRDEAKVEDKKKDFISTRKITAVFTGPFLCQITLIGTVLRQATRTEFLS